MNIAFLCGHLENVSNVLIKPAIIEIEHNAFESNVMPLNQT